MFSLVIHAGPDMTRQLHFRMNIPKYGFEKVTVVLNLFSYFLYRIVFPFINSFDLLIHNL